jgi:hypothetical protein
MRPKPGPRCGCRNPPAAPGCHDFNDQRGGGGQGGQRQADRRDVAHGAGKAGELANAGGQEQGDHSQAGGEVEGVLNGVGHDGFPLKNEMNSVCCDECSLFINNHLVNTFEWI